MATFAYVGRSKAGSIKKGELVAKTRDEAVEHLQTWRGLGLSVLTPLLVTMVGFTLSSGLHYLYRGYKNANAASPMN